MDQIFISRLTARTFGCLQDVSFALTPLHALIGPNDSGKSTILRAVQTVFDFAARDSTNTGSNPWFKHYPFEVHIGFNDNKSSYSIIRPSDKFTELFKYSNQEETSQNELPSALPEFRHRLVDRLSSKEDIAPFMQYLTGGARLVRWDPDALRYKSSLIPENQAIRFSDERGFGLTGVYDAILSRGDKVFYTISDEVRNLFPTVKNLRLKNITNSEKVLEVELKNGKRVPAATMSEGLLFYLAFAALRFIERASILLVEEPENGLHPARISEMVKILREISTTTQVLIATHNPLVINEMEGNEVTVITRDPQRGTQAVRLCDTPNFQERSKVYALGELWVSYADGDLETPLLTKSEKP